MNARYMSVSTENYLLHLVLFTHVIFALARKIQMEKVRYGRYGFEWQFNIDSN